MRSLLLLAAVCCLVLSAYGSPISRQDENKEVSRQAAAPAAPAPASSTDEDDDDDDDDDDDVDLDDALTGDDDDDEEDDDEEEDDEEADDDEDDDYLERFFDDILGDDEDEDDDEPAAVQPVVAPIDTVAAAPAPVAAAAAASSVEEAGVAAEEVESSENEALAEAEEPEAQKEPASAEVETPAASSEAAAVADADDDEEEEDDITDALEDDEDDDDEDEEDDDDDDDDLSDALGRTTAKQARALDDEPVKKPAVPAIYIVKYNRFVDNIIEKMNDILKRSYDPVSVKLQPIDANKKTSKPKKSKNKNKTNKRKTSSKKKNSGRTGSDQPKVKITTTEIPDSVNKINENIGEEKSKIIEQVQTAATESRASKEKSGNESSKAKPASKPKPPSKATKPKPKPPTKTTTKKPAVNKNKVKTSEKSKPRARGTLYGLSSLRRTGDVSVSIMSDHTTVKSNFAVGPLILRVEKEVGRGSKKEIKSATATTAEMTGKISLRVNNQGVATLHSIKVLQPKQVRVDSNHERTRELVWQRSARIAHVVSEKLMSASKPMFLHQSVVRQ